MRRTAESNGGKLRVQTVTQKHFLCATVALCVHEMFNKDLICIAQIKTKEGKKERC
jgi:hypothetical protein